MKILIVRFSSIGDIVLTTPILSAIKEQKENVEIHYLTKSKFSILLEGNTDVDRIHTINKSIDEIVNILKKENFDRIIDLHNNIRTLALKKKLSVRADSFPKLNWEKWLLVKMNVDRMPKLHVVDRYFKAVESLGVVNRGEQCKLIIDEHVDVRAELNVDPKKYIAVSIGAQFNTKRMTAELLVSVINSLDEAFVLVGGETDEDLAHDIISSVNKKVHNAVGKYSIKESASIVAQSKKLLTNDTGMMHIATCFNVHIVSVWGNTVPQLGMYPYYPNNPELFSIHEVVNLKCRPCSKIGFDKCPKGHFNCMSMQNVDELVKDLRN